MKIIIKYQEKMNKILYCFLWAVVAVSSCGTYTGSGAYAGSALGSILGSAIGGISGGPRGSDVGTIVGMAGGAVVGGAIGAKADNQRNAGYERRRRHKDPAEANHRRVYDDVDDNATSYDAGAGDVFDPSGNGDDRLYDFNGSDYTGSYSAAQSTVQMPHTSSVDELASAYSYTPHIEIANARFVDDNRDNAISRGELCKVIFEIYNRGKATLYDIQPMVVDATANNHIFISPGVHVESLEPGKGIRYTALVKADNRLKNGSVKICLSVVHGSRTISKVTEFTIATRK